MPTGKGKHLDRDDRESIQDGIKEGLSFREVARRLDVSPSTISHEVKENRTFRKSKIAGTMSSTRCANYRECELSDLCHTCKSQGHSCKRCKTRYCFDLCSDFEQYRCHKLEKAPFVCDVCKTRARCSFDHALYRASSAQSLYEQRLRESRTGIDCNQADLEIMVDQVKRLLSQGHSLEAIWATHADRFPVGVRTFYNYIERGVMGMSNMELPKKVRYKLRNKKETLVPRSDLTGRTYADWQALEEEERLNTVQMDCVLGRKDDTKVILSLHFPRFSFQFYILLDRKDQVHVAAALDALETYCEGRFSQVFPTILTDRGSEFLNFRDIEKNGRTRVYYCDPVKPGQKGACEKNHVELRKILPKGVTDFDALTISDVSEVSSHVNSYPRPGLGGQAPIALASLVLPKSSLESLGIRHVPADDVIMRPSLLKDKG
ncbi:MAG: IS30 family transposase [Actinobacteria bacterium]|nr:IS30 family transposase [Actinomycetota bacterium]